jgi:hypothetical protein
MRLTVLPSDFPPWQTVYGYFANPAGNVGCVLLEQLADHDHALDLVPS